MHRIGRWVTQANRGAQPHSFCPATTLPMTPRQIFLTTKSTPSTGQLETTSAEIGGSGNVPEKQGEDRSVYHEK